MRWQDATEEEFFHDWLDIQPRDHGARMLFAEWLAERGDARAMGYHWMALHGKAPDHDSTRAEDDRTWDWWSSRADDKTKQSDWIAPMLMNALDRHLKKSRWGQEHRAYCEFRTRRQAEEALVRALIRLGVQD